MPAAIPEKKTFGKKENSGKNERLTIFARGIIVFPPHDAAPEFVKAKIVISLNMFTEFCEEHPELLKDSEKYGPQIALELKESKEGVLYLEVDTYGVKK